jgi:molybdopterin-guanine dinucleotide biosynthesis protein A
MIATMIGDAPSLDRVAYSAIVLAGGKSSRMGLDKSFLTIEGQPLVVRTVLRLASLSDDLIVVTNDVARYELLDMSARLVPDERPGMGALMGIYSGLQASHYPRAVVVACDMPFLDRALLRHMASLAAGYDVVIPRLDGLLEPLHAIYARSCLPFMARLLDQGRRRIVAFFDQVRVCYLDGEQIDAFDPRRLSFANVNTPEDWARVQKLLGQEDLP